MGYENLIIGKTNISGNIKIDIKNILSKIIFRK